MRITKDYLKRVIKEEMNKVLKEYQDPYEFNLEPEVDGAPANKLDYGIGKDIVFQSQPAPGLRTVTGTPFMIKWQSPYRLDLYAKKFKEASGNLSEEEIRASLNKQIKEQRSNLKEVIDGFLNKLRNKGLGEAIGLKEYWIKMRDGADSYVNTILDEKASLDEALKHAFAINTIFYAIRNSNDGNVNLWIKNNRNKNITTWKNRSDQNITTEQLRKRRFTR